MPAFVAPPHFCRIAALLDPARPCVQPLLAGFACKTLRHRPPDSLGRIYRGNLRRNITSSPTRLDWLLRARGLGGARLTAQQTRNPNMCLKPFHLLNESIGVTWSAGRYFFFSSVYRDVARVGSDAGHCTDVLYRYNGTFTWHALSVALVMSVHTRVFVSSPRRKGQGLAKGTPLPVQAGG